MSHIKNNTEETQYWLINLDNGIKFGSIDPGHVLETEQESLETFNTWAELSNRVAELSGDPDYIEKNTKQRKFPEDPFANLNL